MLCFKHEKSSTYTFLHYFHGESGKTCLVSARVVTLCRQRDSKEQCHQWLYSWDRLSVPGGAGHRVLCQKRQCNDFNKLSKINVCLPREYEEFISYTTLEPSISDNNDSTILLSTTKIFWKEREKCS